MDKTTATLARYVTSLRYEDLGPRAIHEAKRHLIDSLGCAMGGYRSEPAVIAREVAPAWGGIPSARLLGEGRPTTPEAAAFANSVMIRFLDANDTYIARGSGHPSDMLGALLAAAEVQGASGKDLLLATVAGYEVFGAMADHVPLRDRGWDQGVFVAPASAAAPGSCSACPPRSWPTRSPSRPRRTWPRVKRGPASWRCGRAARRRRPRRPGCSPRSWPGGG